MGLASHDVKLPPKKLILTLRNQEIVKRSNWPWIEKPIGIRGAAGHQPSISAAAVADTKNLFICGLLLPFFIRDAAAAGRILRILFAPVIVTLIICHNGFLAIKMHSPTSQ